MLTQSETQQVTPEAYLEFEVNSSERHEYINGEIIPVTGGTPNHNELAINLVFALKLALKGQPYSIFVADQRLWIPEANIYTYPDVMVVPRPLKLQAGRTDTITNPLLIAEVLSKGTRNYDKDEKFAAYRTIPSFREYLLIDQYTRHVEKYAQTDVNQWLFSEYRNAEDRVKLASIPVEIALADLYDDLLTEEL
jgi:Uma2 family endonuclease